ncbi:MAG: hypothetical protein WBE86_05320 [Candidatus Acidiferrales bacterium]
MKQSTICILTGAKGGGKTHTAREIISIHPRVFAMEPHGGEFRLPGAVQVYDAEELREAANANWRRSSFLVVCVPNYDVQEASEEVARLSFDYGNLLAVFDEAADYMTASSMGSEMGRLARQSRHRNCNVVFASPRLADLNANARTQADLWICCGPIWTRRDLEVIEENTSTEFRRSCQEPLSHGEFRRLAFDTRTREQITLDKAKLRELFGVSRFAVPLTIRAQPKEGPRRGFFVARGRVW